MAETWTLHKLYRVRARIAPAVDATPEEIAAMEAAEPEEGLVGAPRDLSIEMVRAGIEAAHQGYRVVVSVEPTDMDVLVVTRT